MSSHALNMHMPWNLRGHQDILRAKIKEAVLILPSPAAYGMVFKKKSFDLLITFQA